MVMPECPVETGASSEQDIASRMWGQDHDVRSLRSADTRQTQTNSRDTVPTGALACPMPHLLLGAMLTERDAAPEPEPHYGIFNIRPYIINF